MYSSCGVYVLFFHLYVQYLELPRVSAGTWEV